MSLYLRCVLVSFEKREPEHLRNTHKYSYIPHRTQRLQTAHACTRTHTHTHTNTYHLSSFLGLCVALCPTAEGNMTVIAVICQCSDLTHTHTHTHRYTQTHNSITDTHTHRGGKHNSYGHKHVGTQHLSVCLSTLSRSFH